MEQSLDKGDKKTGWQRAYEAVMQLGKPSSAREILDFILKEVPDYKPANVPADLRLITVNDFSRGHHQAHERSRRTDSQHRYDLLFKNQPRDGVGVTYELYVPALHDVWELYYDSAAATRSKLRTRKLTVGVLEQDLKDAEATAEELGFFDFINEPDARIKVSRSIVLRRGQRAFRTKLIEAYEGVCAITGSTAIDVLEAAHIVPYAGSHTNRVDNGLLLRADVHTLFDLGHIWIDGERVRIATHLMRTEYRDLDGRLLNIPSDVSLQPATAALEAHAARARAAMLASKNDTSAN